MDCQLICGTPDNIFFMLHIFEIYQDSCMYEYCSDQKQEIIKKI